MVLRKMFGMMCRIVKITEKNGEISITFCKEDSARLSKKLSLMLTSKNKTGLTKEEIIPGGLPE